MEVLITLLFITCIFLVFVISSIDGRLKLEKRINEEKNKRLEFKTKEIEFLREIISDMTKFKNKEAIDKEATLINLLRNIKFSYDVTGGIMPQEMEEINKIINE